MEEGLKRSIIIGVAIIITAGVLGNTFRKRNDNLDSISVVGLGTRDFVSDEILWSGEFTTISMDIKTAYSKIVSDQKIVSDFFIKKGFKPNEFSFGAVQFQKKFKEIRIESNERGGSQTRYERVFDGYQATQTIAFSAKKNPA